MLQRFEGLSSLSDQTAYIKQISLNRPFQAAILSLMHAEFPMQVAGLSPLDLANIVLDGSPGVVGFVFNSSELCNNKKSVIKLKR